LTFLYASISIGYSFDPGGVFTERACKASDVVVIGTVQAGSEVRAQSVGAGTVPVTTSTIVFDAVIHGNAPPSATFDTVGDYLEPSGKVEVGRTSWAPGTRHLLGLQMWPGDDDVPPQWFRMVDVLIPADEPIPPVDELRLVFREQCAPHRSDVVPVSGSPTSTFLQSLGLTGASE
jgi:hypothetical protein